MTDIIVIDTNVAVKLYIPDPLSDYAENILQSKTIYAPEWIQAEFYQAIWKYWNSNRLSGDEFREYIERFNQTPISLCRVTNTLLNKTLELSLETGGTIYDCLFLAIALKYKTLLVTSDKKFIKKLKQTPYTKQIIDLADWAEKVSNA